MFTSEITQITQKKNWEKHLHIKIIDLSLEQI